MTLLHADPARSALAETCPWGLIRLEAELSAPVVTVGSVGARLAAGGPDARDQLIAGLGEQGDYALAQGVRLVGEPLNRHETDAMINVDERLAVSHQIGCVAVGLLLDTFTSISKSGLGPSPLERPGRRASRGTFSWARSSRSMRSAWRVRRRAIEQPANRR